MHTRALSIKSHLRWRRVLCYDNFNNDHSLHIVRCIINRKYLGNNSSLKVKEFIGFVKEIHINEYCDRLLNILKLNISNSSNYTYQNFDSKTERERSSLLSALNIPFIPYLISMFIYEIIKLSEKFLDSNILNTKYHRRIDPTLVNIKK